MGYPAKLATTKGDISVHGYSVPGFSGYPDMFGVFIICKPLKQLLVPPLQLFRFPFLPKVVDSDMSNPFRSKDPNVAIRVSVTPDPPNASGVSVQTGQLYNNKLPPVIIPDSLMHTRATFTDDKHALAPVMGIILQQRSGEPDLFLPDDETIIASKLKPSLSGMMAPVGTSTSPPRHGVLLPPASAGDEPKFVADGEGGPVSFVPSDPKIAPMEGTLAPM